MIDTTLYGFHKPEDTDSADLRIFVGQNMDLIESALSALDSAMLTSVDWLEISGLPTTFPPSAHTHDWGDISGEPTFDNYQGWDLIVGATTDRIASLNSLTLVGAGTTNVTYDSALNVVTINSVPTDNFYLSGVSGNANGTVTFTRSGLTDITWNASHTHLWEHITDKPLSFPPSVHTHNWLDINDPPLTYAPSPHNHLWEHITDKPTAFVPVAHSHDWNTDIINLPLTFPPSTHSHAITDVTNLESTLAGKYSTSGGEITGSVIITTAGDMVDLLHFNMDRGWKFKQKGALSSAELLLTSDTNSKRFRISSPLGVDSLEVRVDDTIGSGYIDSPLIKEGGIPLVDKYALKTQIASASNIGMVQVGNGLGMSGNYLLVKTGTGLLIDDVWSVALDSTYLDTNYVQIEATGGTGTVSKLWTGTQAQYDVLVKDPNTVYYIVG